MNPLVVNIMQFHLISHPRPEIVDIRSHVSIFDVIQNQLAHNVADVSLLAPGNFLQGIPGLLIEPD